MSGERGNENPSNDSSSSTGVIIVGAGAAGLTAGYDLHRKGISVLILEANTTLGGRVRKLEGFANDFPIDVGGEWIHSKPSILNSLVDDPKVDLSNIQTKLYQFAPFYKFHGQWKVKYTPLEDADYYRKFINYTWYDFFHDYIAAPIQDCICYCCVVKSIDYNANDVVRVECQDGRVFFGSQVIVTVSLKILQDNDIAFLPPLPDKKIKAINNATYEPGIKLFIEFTEKFYHKDFGIYQKNNRVRGDMYYYDETFMENSNQNILAIFIYSDKAKKYLNMKDENEIVQSILRTLDEAFGGRATRTYVKHFIQDWTNNEPYVKGFYSSYRNGMKPMFEIAKPVGENRIFFAGEALPPNGASYGYVHGAALSGRNAAKGVENVRRGKKPDIMNSWHARMVYGMSSVLLGLEQKLFFNDLDD